MSIRTSYIQCQATLADRRSPDAASLAIYDSAVQLQDKVCALAYQLSICGYDAVYKIQWLQQRMEAMITSGNALCKGEIQLLQVQHRCCVRASQVGYSTR